MVIFAFGSKAVFDEEAVITNEVSADSASWTVIATGPLLAPAQAELIIVGAVANVGFVF